MILKLKLLTWLVLLPVTLICQIKHDKADIQWGQEQLESRKYTLSDIVGHDETGIYTVKTRRRLFRNADLTLEHYNNSMNLDQSSELLLKQNGKEKNYEFITFINGRLFLLSSFQDQRQKKNFLYVQTINKKTLQLSNDIQKIAEIDYSGSGKNNAGSYNFRVSRDSSKLLVYYDLPYKRRESEKFGFHVFNADFSKIWEKQITLPYKEELFDVEDYKVDNEGNIHLLGLIFKEKRKEKRRGEPNYQYQILSYSNEGNELQEYPVKIEGKFLTDMQIAINENREIICSGFYSKEGSFSIVGSYFLKINRDSKDVTVKSLKEFGIDFIVQNMTRKQERKAVKKSKKGKNVELFRYRLDDIIIRSDGGAVLVGEQFFVRVSQTTNGNGQTFTTYYYNYHDIIVVNISPEGQIEWAEKIPKRQVTSNDGGFFSSYAMSVVDDKLYFVFNDNPKNLIREEGKRLANFSLLKESLVVLVELDADGKRTTQPLFSSRDADIITRPKVCEQISRKEMVLYGQRRRKHRFAKITFK